MENLEKKFKEAYKVASNTTLRFPPDLMLQFYAYYKRATQNDGFYIPTNENDLRNGFKANAMFQIKEMSKEEAKLKYIEMVEHHICEI